MSDLHVALRDAQLVSQMLNAGMVVFPVRKAGIKQWVYLPLTTAQGAAKALLQTSYLIYASEIEDTAKVVQAGTALAHALKEASVTGNTNNKPYPRRKS